MDYFRSLNFEVKLCISDLKRIYKKLLIIRGMEIKGKLYWIIKKNNIPQNIDFGKLEEEEDPNYKKKLKDIFRKQFLSYKILNCLKTILIVQENCSTFVSLS